MNKIRCSGQLFSGDLAVASIIFLTALSVVFFIWNSTTTEISEAEGLQEMQKMSTNSLEQLIRTPGVPSNWNRFTVITPGIASEDRIINSTKASEFLILMNASNYDSNLHIMGLGRYNFYLNVTDLNKTLVNVGATPFIAGLPPSGETDAITTYRTAIFNSTIVRLTFTIWK